MKRERKRERKPRHEQTVCDVTASSDPSHENQTCVRECYNACNVALTSSGSAVYNSISMYSTVYKPTMLNVIITDKVLISQFNMILTFRGPCIVMYSYN